MQVFETKIAPITDFDRAQDRYNVFCSQDFTLKNCEIFLPNNIPPLQLTLADQSNIPGRYYFGAKKHSPRNIIWGVRRSLRKSTPPQQATFPAPDLPINEVYFQPSGWLEGNGFFVFEGFKMGQKNGAKMRELVDLGHYEQVSGIACRSFCHFGDFGAFFIIGCHSGLFATPKKPEYFKRSLPTLQIASASLM